jgi:methionyl-tRNA formyltransferase
MRMEAGLDSGPVWHMVRSSIGADDTTGALFARLAVLGADALIETLPSIVAGAVPAPQDESQVTLAPKIDRDLARIRWDASAREVSCRVRAMDPYPGAWTTVAGESIKLFAPSSRAQRGTPSRAARGPSTSVTS